MIEKYFDYLLFVVFLAGIGVVSLLWAGTYYGTSGPSNLLITLLISATILATFSLLTFIIAKKDVKLKYKLVVPAIFLMTSILGLVLGLLPCSGEGCLGNIIVRILTSFIFYVFIATIFSLWIAVLSKERKYKYACLALAAGVITLAPPVYISIVSTIDAVSCFAAAPLRGKETKSECYGLAARAFRSPGLCNNIELADHRYYCTSELALKQEDPEICKELGPDMTYPFRAEDCIKRVASRTYSPSACMAMDNPASRESCLLLVAKRTGRDELCAELTTPRIINMCYSDIAVGNDYDADRMGPLSMRPELCDKMVTARYYPSKNDCYHLVAEKQNSPEICKKVEHSFKRVTCMSVVALSLAKPEVCDELSTLYEKESCSYKVGLETLSRKDFPDMCRELTDPKARVECLDWVAKTIDSAELCREIDDQKKKDSCLQYLAAKLNKPKNCEEIKGMNSRDACYFRVAKKNNRPELCKKISTTNGYYARLQCSKSVRRW